MALLPSVFLDNTTEVTTMLKEFKLAEMVYKAGPRDITVLARGVCEGLQFKVISLGSHPCAYIGVPLTDFLAGSSYNDIPIDVHGGFTFAREGDSSGNYLDSGYFWFGWDYGHAGDYAPSYGFTKFGESPEDKKWSTDEILDEVWSACYDFKALQRLSEHIILQWTKRFKEHDISQLTKFRDEAYSHVHKFNEDKE